MQFYRLAALLAMIFMHPPRVGGNLQICGCRWPSHLFEYAEQSTERCDQSEVLRRPVAKNSGCAHQTVSRVQSASPTRKRRHAKISRRRATSHTGARTCGRNQATCTSEREIGRGRSRPQWKRTQLPAISGARTALSRCCSNPRTQSRSTQARNSKPEIGCPPLTARARVSYTCRKSKWHGANLAELAFVWGVAISWRP